MPSLTLLRGALTGQRFSFSGAVVVGRGTLADIRLDDTSVSRRHAELRPAGDDWQVSDLGSANGTLCDAAAIISPHTLTDGCELAFGDVRVRFEIGVAEQAAGLPFPRLIARLDLLARVAGLAARRDDPASLAGEALALMAVTFDGVTAAIVYTHAGPRGLAAFANHGDADAADPTCATASLRHVHGFAGPVAALTDNRGARGHVLAAPIVLAGETLGTLVVHATPSDAFTTGDDAIAKALATSLASLLGAYRDAHPERRVAERDLQLARRVQQHFLPANLPALDGYAFAERYLPARVVGGDHLDVFRFADDRLGILIADVAGKAVSAALVMARLGMAVRLLGAQSPGPADLLVSLNTLLGEELESGMFVTAQVLALSTADGHLEIANAGHPAPLHRRRDGIVSSVPVEAGAPLGASARTTFPVLTATLEPGSAWLLYTDGLDEAVNTDDERFGLERAIATVAPVDGAAAMLDALDVALAGFVGGAAAADDLTLFVVERISP